MSIWTPKNKTVDFYINKFSISDGDLIKYIKKYVSDEDVKVINGFYIYKNLVYHITKAKRFKYWSQVDDNLGKTGYSNKCYSPDTVSMLDLGINIIPLDKDNYKGNVKEIKDKSVRASFYISVLEYAEDWEIFDDDDHYFRELSSS